MDDGDNAPLVVNGEQILVTAITINPLPMCLVTRGFPCKLKHQTGSVDNTVEDQHLVVNGELFQSWLLRLIVNQCV